MLGSDKHLAAEDFLPLMDTLGDFRAYLIHLAVGFCRVGKGKGNEVSNYARKEEEIIRTRSISSSNSGSTQPTSIRDTAGLVKTALLL
jgi:hypothetical protein